MSIPDGITRDDVLAGIADFEAGVPHRFGPSTGYDLLYEGIRYPPKAVLGLAAGHTTGEVLVPADFSGGEESKCFRILRELEFTIVPKDDTTGDVGPPQRAVVAWVFQANPKLFAIDEYLSRQTFIYWVCPRFADRIQLGMPVFIKRSGKDGGIIASGSIAELPVASSAVEKPSFLREDLWTEPAQQDFSRVGISLDDVRLSNDEGLIPTRVLESIPELTGHPLVTVRQGTIFRLSAEHAAGLFRVWGGGTTPAPQSAGLATEGSRILVTHRKIERNRKLIADKKADFRRQHGRLFCEVCNADHSDFYGPLWSERVIEAHHLKPLGELEEACISTLNDLMLACSNCHALIHQSVDVDGNLNGLRQHFGRISVDDR